MIINKENTKYGYKSTIKYNVKAPVVHVIHENETMKITGEADITIITGQISIKKENKSTLIYDSINDKETAHIPQHTTMELKATKLTVLLEDNKSENTMEQYLNLTVTESEPSSEDLEVCDF